MGKVIKLLALLCLGLLLVSCLLTAGAVLLQKPLLRAIYGLSGGVFTVPVGVVVSILAYAIILGLLCLVAGSRKLGIWSDLIVLALTVLSPLTSFLSNFLQTVITGRYGYEMMSSFSAVNNLCNITMSLGSLGLTLGMVVCGMSIAYKLMAKKER